MINFLKFDVFLKFIKFNFNTIPGHSSFFILVYVALFLCSQGVRLHIEIEYSFNAETIVVKACTITIT